MIHHTTHRTTYTPFPPQPTVRSLHRARLCDSRVYTPSNRVSMCTKCVLRYTRQTLYRGVSVKYQDGTRLEKGRDIDIAKIQEILRCQIVIIKERLIKDINNCYLLLQDIILESLESNRLKTLSS